MSPAKRTQTTRAARPTRMTLPALRYLERRLTVTAPL